MQEKKDLINSCNDLVAAVKEQEHDLSAEVRAVYKDAEVLIESEKKAFRSGYEDRLQKVRGVHHHAVLCSSCDSIFVACCAVPHSEGGRV